VARQGQRWQHTLATDRQAVVDHLGCGEARSSVNVLGGGSDLSPKAQALASIVSMGFELEEAGAALAAHGGDAQAAVDQLLSS